jgi:beta-glucosidase
VLILTAIADVLFGNVNPSGRLAMTFPTTLEECPTTKSFSSDEGGLLYEEESNFGYRAYERDGVLPAYRE